MARITFKIHQFILYIETILKKIFKVDCIPKQNFQQRESLLFNIKCH